MAWFKKKINVNDYCDIKLKHLFSPDREKIWEQMRTKCHDPAFNSVEKSEYYLNLRAVYLQLIGIGIAKKCHMDVYPDFSVYLSDYLEKNNFQNIEQLSGIYNRAFGSSYTDGIKEMVILFSQILTDSKMSSQTIEIIYTEFYGILNIVFDEFRDIKLVAK